MLRSKKSGEVSYNTRIIAATAKIRKQPFEGLSVRRHPLKRRILTHKSIAWASPA
jgi:hypothetical protein